MSKNEAETRKEMIDTRLMEAGWDINDRAKVVQEYDLLISADTVKDANDPYTGHQFCDYVLMGRDGNPMAVVEAKRSTKDPAIGREQAKQYCHYIQNIKKADLPFCFYTNGHEIFYWDLDNYPPRKVYGYKQSDNFKFRLRPERKNGPLHMC